MKKQLLFFFSLFLISIKLWGQNTGIRFYKVINYQNSTETCLYCIDLNTIEIGTEPIITEEDIEYFNWQNQQVKLTQNGQNKVSNLNIPLTGLPVVITLNEKIIYYLWFWNTDSSFGCDRVYTFPTVDFKISFGLPKNNHFGNDPRFDELLKNYILDKHH